MLEYLSDNIGFMLACLLQGSTNATASPSQYMTQPSGIPILSPTLYTFMHVGDPFLNSKNFSFSCLASFFLSFREVVTQVYMYMYIQGTTCTLSTTVMTLVCSLNGMRIPSFVLIGCYVSELYSTMLIYVPLVMYDLKLFVYCIVYMCLYHFTKFRYSTPSGF